MAVDRGGLQYTIRIVDQFSGPLDKFTKDVLAAKTALDSLGKGTAALQKNAEAIRKISAESRKAATASKKQASQELNTARIKEAALRRELKLKREQAIAQRQATIAAKEAFNNARRLATEDQRNLVAQKRLTKVINERSRAQRVLNAARQRGVKLSLEEKQKLGVITEQERELLRIQRARQRLTAIAGNERIRKLDAETEAKRRAIRADRQALVEQTLAAQGRTRTGALIAQEERLTRAQRTRIAVLDRLRRSLKRTGDTANRVSFTFRRLFGILAAFAAARAILRAFRNLTVEIVRFSAAIEQAELGIASLFLAVGDVRTLFGDAVGSAQGLDLAIAEARKQMAQLRVDALRTAGTFEDLLTAFQVAVAPGLQAGLSIDEVRKFTIDISRAATAIGLQQNQLAEEIRSILSGTIQARTTRIAVALGITNEQIRNAKEAGILIEFLNERFEAFGEAGERALKTFNALFTNLKGAIQILLESGGIEFFTAVKDTLKELFDLVATEDVKLEALTPNPEAVAVIRAFANGLRDAVLIANEVRKALTFTEVILAVKAVSAGLRIITTILAGVIEGAITGIALVVAAVTSIGKALNRITRGVFDLDLLQQVFSILTTIVVVLLAMQTIGAILNGIWALRVVLISAFSAVLFIVSNTLKVIRGTIALIAFLTAPLTAVPALILATIATILLFLAIGVIELKKWADEITGIKLSFSSFFKFIAAQIKFIFSSTTDLIANTINSWTIQVKKFVVVITNLLVAGLAKGLRFALKDVEFPGIEALRGALLGVAAAADAAQKTDLLIFNTELAFLKIAAENAAKALDEDLKKAIDNLVAADPDSFKLKEFLTGAANDAIDALVGLFKDIDLSKLLPTIDLGDAIKGATTFSEALAVAGGIIAESRKGLADNAELMKKLTEEAESAAAALRTAEGTIGLTNSALTLRTAILKRNNRLIKESKELNVEETKVRLAQNLAEVSLARNLAVQRSRQASQEQKFLRESRLAAEAIQKAEDEAADATNARVISELALVKVRKEGTVQQLADAQKLTDERKEAETAAADELVKVKDTSDARLANIELEEDVRARLTALTLEQIALEGLVGVNQERLLAIANDRITLERTLQSILAQRLVLLAKQSAFDADLRKATSDIELFRLAAEQRIRAQLNNADIRVTLAQAELKTLTAENRLAQDERDRNTQAQRIDLIKQKAELSKLQAEKFATPAGEDTKALDEAIKFQVQALVALTKEREAAILASAAALGVEVLEVERLAFALEQLRLQAEQPVIFGFTEGLKDFARQASDVFTQVQAITVSAFDAIANTIGTTLTNALAGVEQDIRQVFADLLRGIAEQIVQMLIRIAIAKALTAGLGGHEGGQIGRARGGEIPYQKPEPHRIAKGFALGGRLTPNPIPNMRAPRSGRPKGLHPADTVPIWTEPGEWVIRKKAVQHYGADLINALNSMLINPAALRAVAGINGAGRAIRRISGGRQTGGEIERAQSQALAPAPVQAAQESTGPVVALVAGTDENMQQMLVGGKNALLDFLRENRDEFLGGRGGG